MLTASGLIAIFISNLSVIGVAIVCCVDKAFQRLFRELL